MYSIDSTVLYHYSTTSSLTDVTIPPKDIIGVDVDDSNHSTHSASPPAEGRALPIEIHASSALSHLFGSLSIKRPSTLDASMDDDDVRDLPRRFCHLAPNRHHRYPNFVLLLLLLRCEEDGRYGREYHPASDAERLECRS